MTSTISIPGPGLPIDVRFGYAVYGDRHANPGSPSAPWYMVNDRKSASTLVATGETPIIMVGIYTEPEVAFMRITETDRGIGRATNLNAAGEGR